MCCTASHTVASHRRFNLRYYDLRNPICDSSYFNWVGSLVADLWWDCCCFCITSGYMKSVDFVSRFSHCSYTQIMDACIRSVSRLSSGQPHFVSPKPGVVPAIPTSTWLPTLGMTLPHTWIEQEVVTEKATKHNNVDVTQLFGIGVFLCLLLILCLCFWSSDRLWCD
jgi:hypothetical protein